VIIIDFSTWSLGLVAGRNHCQYEEKMMNIIDYVFLQKYMMTSYKQSSAVIWIVEESYMHSLIRRLY
jgi:hypothetical protein